MTAPNDVVDRLERLAAHAPAGTVDPDATWSLGRRRQTRGWVTAAVCAALLAGVGAAVAPPLAALVDPPVTVSPDSTVRHLPDVVREPGGRAPAFVGAPGPLVAIGVGERSGWFSTSDALWGVSAVTGESRFLELPLADDHLDQAVLSADGTKLAYWSSTGVAGQADDGGRAATGVSVLDLVTGEQDSWSPEAEFGVMAGGLAWAGDTVWFESGEHLDRNRNSAKPRYYSWNPGISAAEDRGPEFLGRADLDGSVWIDTGGFVAGNGSSMKWVRRVTVDGRVSRIDLVTDGAASSPVVSPDGRRLAAVSQRSVNRYEPTGRPLLVGEISGTEVVLRKLDPIDAEAVLGWRSPTEVVVLDPGEGSYVGGARVGHVVRRVDVSRPEKPRSAVLTFVEAGTVPRFAADAWTWPVVAAPDVSSGPHPLWFGAATAGLGLVLMAGWRGLRRRRGHP